MPPAASFLQKARQKTLNKGFLRTTFSYARCEHERAEQGLRERQTLFARLNCAFASERTHTR